MMRSYRRYSLLLALMILLVLAVTVSAQEKYPDRPVTIVAPFPPGGVADLTAGPGAAALENGRKNPVVVVNKTSAAGDVGTSYGRNRKDDADTLLTALVTQASLP